MPFDLGDQILALAQHCGIATVKCDGTCCALMDGKFYRLLEAVENAKGKGLLNDAEAHNTLKQLYKND